jgi:hypothetical protein
VFSYLSTIEHKLICPVRRRWLRWRWNIPFWSEDKVTQMLLIANFGCPRCGRNAIEERDAAFEEVLKVCDCWPRTALEAAPEQAVNPKNHDIFCPVFKEQKSHG